MALNVLIVDDSSVTRRMIGRALEMSGLDLGGVHEAGNGLEALSILDGQWVDLALVDVNMPEMNGEELLSRIRSRPATAQLPVVVVSTEGSETRIARLRAMGASFVRKPFQPADLRSTVLQLLGMEDDDV